MLASEASYQCAVASENSIASAGLKRALDRSYHLDGLSIGQATGQHTRPIGHVRRCEVPATLKQSVVLGSNQYYDSFLSSSTPYTADVIEAENKRRIPSRAVVSRTIPTPWNLEGTKKDMQERGTKRGGINRVAAHAKTTSPGGRTLSDP